jgi:hypothetical protein
LVHYYVPGCIGHVFNVLWAARPCYYSSFCPT